MKSYTDLFAQRGSAYDRAMRRWPDARDEEFAQAVRLADPQPGMVVADIPAGGGYLRRHLPPGCTWQGHEPCASFTNHGDVHGSSAGVPLLPLPFADASVDCAISLAGVHHLDDKRPLFAELARVVRPGGRLVLSDVAQGHAVARFLDGFVGDHNSTGHDGVFLGPHTLEELAETGWIIRQAGLEPFHWVFDDAQAMAGFCMGLFDIGRATLTQTTAAITRELGVDPLPGGRIGMRWALYSIVAHRPA